jgi:Secretion system C-terminal sorting domain
MKTLKVILILGIIMIMNQMVYSYTVNVISPNHCIDYPTHINYTSNEFVVNFYIEREFPEETNMVHVIIGMAQRGSSVAVYSQTVETFQNIYATINLSSFQNLCYNEPIEIIVQATSVGIFTLPYFGYGYLFVHKNVISCTYGSLSNGTSSLLNSGQTSLFASSNCNVPSGNYNAERYRVRFVLDGDFTDSTPVIIPQYCFGFDPSTPNYQFYWGRLVSQTNTQAIFETYVYANVWDLSGTFVGNVPCSPQDARIVYYWCKKARIDSLVQYPRPVSYGTAGYVTCYLQNRDGNILYNWSDTNRLPYTFFTSLGDRARFIRYETPLDKSEVTPEYQICCKVSNECSATPKECLNILWRNDPPQQCLNIGFIEDSTFISENNILNPFQSVSGNVVRDFYILKNPFISKKDMLEFRVFETENDITNLDLMELYLVTTDHQYNFAITNDGEEIAYKSDPEKVKVILNNSEDVSFILSKNDNNVKDFKAGDKLVFTFIQDGSEYVVLDSWVLNKDKIAGIITTNEGNDYPFFSRQNDNLNCIKIKKEDLKEFTIEIKQDIVIDQLECVKNEGGFQKVKLNLKAAYDKYGDITNDISIEDGKCTRITKGNEAEFIYANNPNSTLRTQYFIKAVGNYMDNDSPETNNNMQKINPSLDYKLFDNTPNPFNPITNIKFEIPADGLVKLTVYDITGREIKTLLNEFKTAGSYEITFDGSDFASGIYFYKMEANNFKETKRMILIK